MSVTSFLLVFFLLSGVRSEQWDYVSKKPDVWPYLEGELFKECGGNQQSPINIRKADVTCDAIKKFVKPIQFSYADQLIEFKFINKAFTIGALVKDTEANYLFSGSGLPSGLAPFRLAQFHFHWGQHVFEGSEHTFEYEYSPLEVHYVHVSTVDPAYYAVIGVLFELSSTPNANLESIIRVADNLAINVNSSYTESVNIGSLLPTNLDRFYFYDGSLTIPPCTEKVFWTVMADKITISQSQLDSIYKNPSKTNFRPLQPLNNRPVTTISCELAGKRNLCRARR